MNNLQDEIKNLLAELEAAKKALRGLLGLPVWVDYEGGADGPICSYCEEYIDHMTTLPIVPSPSPAQRWERERKVTAYTDLLLNKQVNTRATGFNVSPDDINPALFDWQRDVTRWALHLGRAALFEECGLGKTAQQLEWSRHVTEHTGGKVLILAPLAVAHQTVREGVKFGISAIYCRSQAEADAAPESIIVANYEMLGVFDAQRFTGIVLDESSILKSFTGKTKRTLIDQFESTPFKLACTATPAPNDHLELGNHAEFLGIMPSNEMISRWFINDSMEAGAYRLKHHAEQDFWRWVTSWAVCISTPSDLGYDDNGFILPELHFHEHTVGVDHSRAWDSGRLLLDAQLSATDMWREKRATANDRAQRARDIVDEYAPDDYWVLWCDTNYEADALMALFPESVEVRGSHSLKVKEERLRAFSEGRERVIITKPDIAGFGLNWQHCRNQAFVGVTYSFEKLYQALRRSWRFMVQGEVNAHVITAESEGNIMDTIHAKQEDFRVMQHAMNAAMAEHGLFRTADNAILTRGVVDAFQGDNWMLYQGDCVLTTQEKIADNSIDFTVFSPPFSTLYIYSKDLADMGNNASHDEFFKQFGYLPPELLRVTRPGRLCAVHCKDLPLYMNRDGAAGLYDFPGALVQAFESAHIDSDPEARWVYHSRVTIWKDPVIEMQRTKNHGLLHKNFAERGEVCRQGMADYLLVFRKWTTDTPDKQVQHHIEPGEFDYAGTNPPTGWDSDDYYSIQVWQRYASPVWFDIDQTNVLNYQMAKGDRDEKHICPLQLDVIKRAVQLWTNEGDLVFSPFTGIGSEGHEALLLKRRFVGIELKPEYIGWAVRFLTEAARQANQPDLFSFANIEV